jgi:hypothetical protein
VDFVPLILIIISSPSPRICTTLQRPRNLPGSERLDNDAADADADAIPRHNVGRWRMWHALLLLPIPGTIAYSIYYCMPSVGGAMHCRHCTEVVPRRSWRALADPPTVCAATRARGAAPKFIDDFYKVSVAFIAKLKMSPLDGTLRSRAKVIALDGP